MEKNESNKLVNKAPQKYVMCFFIKLFICLVLLVIANLVSARFYGVGCVIDSNGIRRVESAVRTLLQFLTFVILLGFKDIEIKKVMTSLLVFFVLDIIAFEVVYYLMCDFFVSLMAE